MSAIIWDEESRQFSVVGYQREFTWQDPATGIVYKGAKGDKSSPVHILGDAEDFYKTKKGKATKYTGGTGTNRTQVTRTAAQIKKDNAAFVKDLKTSEGYKKGKTSYGKITHTAKNRTPEIQARINAMNKLKGLKAENSNLLKSNRNLKIGAGIAGAAAIGAGAYALKKRREAKKREEEATRR